MPSLRPSIRLGSYLALTVAASLIGCDADSENPKPSPPPRQLVIVTPHNEKIRSATASAFSNWYAKNHSGYVTLEWVVMGTPECVAYAQDAAERLREGEARVHRRVDVMFGGGINDHQSLADRGLSRPMKKLAEFAKEIPPTVAGLPTRDGSGRWCATALSSFGILFNERAAKLRGIAPPATWDDLADPRFQGWLGIADPGASGSHLQCMIILLQKYGWNDGWSRLIRILANSRALVERSGTAIRQTQNGVFLASFAVNFDGLSAQDEAAQTVRYVNPAGATACTVDAASVLAMTDDPELAEDFVRFCLSEEAQLTFGGRSNQTGEALHHFPILPSAYAKQAGGLTVTENPYQTDFGVKFDLAQAGKQGVALLPLIAAACGENHVALQQAWQAVAAAGMPAAALSELTSPPLDEVAAVEFGEKYRLAAPEDAAKLVGDLATRMAEKYKKVIELSRGSS